MAFYLLMWLRRKSKESVGVYKEIAARFSFHFPIIFTVDQSKIFSFFLEKRAIIFLTVFPSHRVFFILAYRGVYKETGVERMNGKGNHQKSTSVAGHRDFSPLRQIEFKQIFVRSIIDLGKMSFLLFASMICFRFQSGEIFKKLLHHRLMKSN